MAQYINRMDAATGLVHGLAFSAGLWVLMVLTAAAVF